MQKATVAQTSSGTNETLEINQNMAFQRKMWTIQRITWVVLLILTVLIALGFAGGFGPYNYVTASSEKMELSYQPRARRLAPTNIEVEIKQLTDNTARLLVSQDFINNYQVESITPQPDSVKSNAEMLVYEFSAPEGARSMKIKFYLQADNVSIGSHKGLIGPDSDSLVKIKQFVYP